MDSETISDQLYQRMSSVTIADAVNEPQWCSTYNHYNHFNDDLNYGNSAEHQLVACDSCFQQCEVAHFNSLGSNGYWDVYERLNNNIEMTQPSLLYLLASGCIANFGKDEKGSRFIQEEFTKSSPTVRQMMFDYLFERGGFDWFSSDPHGNFIIQKIAVEALPGIEQARFTEHVANKVVKLCSNRYGSRIMQRIFERFEFGNRVELLNKLSGSECFLAVDSCATHVIQELEKAAYTSRYHDAPTEFREARRLLNKLLRRLTENCAEFTDHQFANYVVQHVIVSEFHPEARDFIIKRAILSNVLTLSQEKFASHVVEKALKYASPRTLQCLMNEIFDGYITDDRGRDALDVMLFDQYGNYVVQTMINVSIDVREGKREGNSNWLALLCDRVARHEPKLLRYSSGKKIIGKLREYAV